VEAPASDVEGLRRAPGAHEVHPVLEFEPALYDSIAVIEAVDLPCPNTDVPLSGDGKTIAVLATGIASGQASFAGADATRVVPEACFTLTAACPNGHTEQNGSIPEPGTTLRSATSLTATST